MSARRIDAEAGRRGVVGRPARATLAGIAALVAVSAGPAAAQLYKVPWSTIDCGGTVASSAPYALRGTLGQHDADEPQGGGVYDLLGGFWSGVRELRRAIFADGFETGNTVAWSATLPLAPAERLAAAADLDADEPPSRRPR
jgi:hypothetical protein